MNNNILNKNLILYHIQGLNKISNLILLITLNLGWLVLPLKQNQNIQLEPIIFGYNRIYKFFFKVKGFGYKWKYLLTLKRQKQSIFFKLGYTHRILLLIKENNKYTLTKRRFIIKSRNYTYLRNNLNLLFCLYKNYLYNKKGIYLRGTKFKLKISKKKSKF